LDDRRRDGGTNPTLRIKEQGTHLTLNEHDDDENTNKLKQRHVKYNLHIVGGFVVIYIYIYVCMYVCIYIYSGYFKCVVNYIFNHLKSHPENGFQ